MDIFAISGTGEERQFRIIELKKDPPDKNTVEELFRYIEWTKQFIKGANERNIQPVLLCRNLKNISLSQNVIEGFHSFNYRSGVLPLQYIECIRDYMGDIRFHRVEY